MSEVKQGDTVKVHYTGTLADGSVFDSSREREPLEFTVGRRQLIPGFETAVSGMKVGEKQTVVIEPEEAYGAPREEMMITVDRGQFPPEFDIQVGSKVPLQSPDGQQVIALISDFDEDEVTLDANHPLAGKQLTFEIEVMEIVGA